MPRQVRIEFPGAFYHVMCRGDRKEDIFKDTYDRKRFLETLGEVCAKCGWRIHAFVLMSNHYHWLLETPEANLVKGMTWFQTTYTVRYNLRHKMAGHLFGGRYKAVLVEADSHDYFGTLMDYIHLNPVRAGLLKFAGENAEGSVIDYPWSSVCHYALRSAKRPPWLETNRGFGNFGFKDSASGRKEFVERLDQRARHENGLRCGLVEIERQDPQSTLRRGWFYGSHEFKTRLLEFADGILSARSEAASNYTGQEIRDHGQSRAESIIIQALDSFSISEDDLSRMKKSAPEKIVIACCVRRETAVPLTWLAERLKMGTPINVSRLTNQSDTSGRTDQTVRDLYQKLSKILE